LWDKSLVDKDFATAAAAEQHIIRLRAELNAVTTARATVQETFNNSHLSEDLKALDGLKGEISAPDILRARHLLRLMDDWDNSGTATVEKQITTDLILTGDIDSAARRIRHHNAFQTAENTNWLDAESGQHEYVVEDFAKVDLLAWPAFDAPRTGYCLGPKTRFCSKVEQLDNEGNTWILVDETTFAFSDCENEKTVTVDPNDNYANRKLLGCQVSPGPLWGYENVGNVGIINEVRHSSVRVKWSVSGSENWYNPATESKANLVYANPPSAQGWFCTTPRQISVVRRGRSALRCFGCGDGLVPEDSQSQNLIAAVQKSDPVAIGDSLLVAATLEPVEVTGIEKDYVLCSFPTKSAVGSIPICYQRKDLVKPVSKPTKVSESVLVDGRWRSRHELVMKLGAGAKGVWELAKACEQADGNWDQSDEPASQFSSCVKGHLLHARCFQEALLGGQCCPASGCNEPLWIPKIRRLRRDDDACCENGSETGGGIDVGAGNVEIMGAEAVARARQEHGDVSYPMNQELKMCPSCCSGPLINQNCNDMEAHHGQCVHHAFGRDEGDPCYFCADAKDIASSLLQLSGDKKVVDVLPKCPTHRTVIMFSGCMVCGHLFTDASWSHLPKWDPTAKTMLDLDLKKRRAAALLVSDITREVALLGFERHALANKWNHAMAGNRLPSLPPPAMGFGPLDSDSDSEDDSDGDY
jgi:hypothetical protein